MTRRITIMSSHHRSLENSIGLDMIYEEEADAGDCIAGEPGATKRQMSTRSKRRPTTTNRRTRRGRMPGAEFKLITQKLMELQRK